MNNWLLVGPIEYWRIALSSHLWGFRDVITMRTLREKIANGDSVFFYVKAPVSGIVGIGRVKGRVFTGDKPLWPDEIQSNKVIYLHRLAFETSSALEQEQWTNRAVKLIDLRLSLKIYSAVNPIPDPHLI